MIVYEVYCDSLHKIRYSYGIYLKKEDAEIILSKLNQSTATGPVWDIEEIHVIEELKMSTEKESSLSDIKDSKSGQTIPDSADFDMSKKDENNDISKKHVDSNDISVQAFEKWWVEQCDNELFKTKFAVIVKIVEGEAKKAFQAGMASRELKLPDAVWEGSLLCQDWYKKCLFELEPTDNYRVEFYKIKALNECDGESGEK